MARISIHFLLITVILVILSKRANGQFEFRPVQITNLTNLPTGILVEWRVETEWPILSQTLESRDDFGRVRRQQVSTHDRSVVLQFVRPCHNYRIQIGVNAENQYFTSKWHKITRSPVAAPVAPRFLNLEETQRGYKIAWSYPKGQSHVSSFFISGKSDDGKIIEQHEPYLVHSAELKSFPYWNNYNVSISAENTCGRSNESTAIRVKKIIPPAKPIILSVTSTDTQIEIQFRPNRTKSFEFWWRLEYSMENKTKAVLNLNKDDRNAILVEGLAKCFEHSLELYAGNVAGVSEPAIVTVYLKSEEVPYRPIINRVSETSAGHMVFFSVTYSKWPLKQHKITYKENFGASNVLDVNGSLRTVLFDSPKPCRNYTFRLSSLNTCGWSVISEPYIYAKEPYDVPDAVQLVDIIGKGNTIYLSWERSNDTKYLLQYDILLVDDKGLTQSYWVPPTATSFVLKVNQSSMNKIIVLRSRNACGWSDPVDVKYPKNDMTKTIEDKEVEFDKRKENGITNGTSSTISVKESTSTVETMTTLQSNSTSITNK